MASYNSLINKSAAIINGYRQMTSANNIRMALKYGLKVYMNNKNVHKSFLENQGFKIFSIEDFEIDLKTDNIYPDKQIAKYNLETFKRCRNSWTIDDFQKELFQKLNFK